MGSDPTKVSMGTTYLTARIRRLDKQGAGYTDKFLVDSGATETMVDGDRLRSIGIEPEDELDIELADGSLHTYPMGSARIAVFDGLFGPGGKEITNPVLFGPDFGFGTCRKRRNFLTDHRRRPPLENPPAKG